MYPTQPRSDRRPWATNLRGLSLLTLTLALLSAPAASAQEVDQAPAPAEEAPATADDDSGVDAPADDAPRRRRQRRSDDDDADRADRSPPPPDEQVVVVEEEDKFGPLACLACSCLAPPLWPLWVVLMIVVDNEQPPPTARPEPSPWQPDERRAAVAVRY